LSYTTFSYSDLVVSGGFGEDLQVTVRVKNTGKMDGAETVLWFTFDDYRIVTPEHKRLRAFEKVFLLQDEEKNVSQTIAAEELRFVGPHDDSHYIADPAMTFWVGVGPYVDCRSSGAESNGMCVHVEYPKHDSTDNMPYIGACEAACDVWNRSGCMSHVGLSTHACLSMCTAVNNHPFSKSDMVKEGWGFNYVRCIENIVTGFERQNQFQDTDQCFKMTTFCRDIFRTTQMDEFGAGPQDHHNILHGQTPVSYAIALLAAIISSLLMFHALFGRMDGHRPPETGPDDGVLPTPYRLLQDDSDFEQNHENHASHD
jgi:beta-glucosidase